MNDSNNLKLQIIAGVLFIILGLGSHDMLIPTYENKVQLKKKKYSLFDCYKNKGKVTFQSINGEAFKFVCKYKGKRIDRGLSVKVGKK